MEITQRIPMDNAGYSFGYIEFTKEYESPEDAIADNARLVKSAGAAGHNVPDWAKIRRLVLNGGVPTIEEMEAMNKYQRAWLQDTNNTIKSLNDKEDKTID